MARTSNIRWKDDGVCFVLEQHTQLDFHCDLAN